MIDPWMIVLGLAIGVIWFLIALAVYLLPRRRRSKQPAEAVLILAITEYLWNHDAIEGAEELRAALTRRMRTDEQIGRHTS